MAFLAGLLAGVAAFALWLVLTLKSTWATTFLAKRLIAGMSTGRKREILVFITSYVQDVAIDSDDDHWSLVSEESPSSSPRNYTTCRHLKATWHGSNQYQRRLTCKICGKILYFQDLRAAPKSAKKLKKSTKTAWFCYGVFCRTLSKETLIKIEFPFYRPFIAAGQKTVIVSRMPILLTAFPDVGCVFAGYKFYKHLRMSCLRIYTQKMQMWMFYMRDLLFLSLI